MYPVIETEFTPNGKYRVRVDLLDGSTAFFKFHCEPTQDEIDTVVAQYLENINVVTSQE